jgi:hypothetical protein
LPPTEQVLSFSTIHRQFLSCLSKLFCCCPQGLTLAAVLRSTALFAFSAIAARQ